MRYRGTLNLDFTNPDANKQTRLSLALCQAGWKHVETSAFVLDDVAIDDLWEGIGLVARYAATVGPVSALTFHIQAAEIDFATNVAITSTQSPAYALAEIKTLKFPKDP